MRPPQRPELVAKLKAFTRSELAAYCDGVLAGAGLHSPPEVVEAIRVAMEPRRAKVIDLRPRRSRVFESTCPDCGATVVRRQKIDSWPMRRHRAACPSRLAVAA